MTLDDLTKLNFLSGTAKPGPYTTPLTMLDELKFQNWAKQNKVPMTNDYDMRGYWKAMSSGDPRATQTRSAFDNTMHFPDIWKTPLHHSFSNESIYATPNAPGWVGDTLRDKLGTILVDERPKK